MTTTTTLDISEARKQFSKLDVRLRDDPLIWITRHNKRAFAVVDMELMEAVLETLDILQDPNALSMFQASLADVKAGRMHDHSEIERDLA
ncbi:MAG: type II toxin-antitoxin system Phd/YefM family antitoxin [Gemmataceae bacterium]|nr:type II toxin-antitoxin system Phd/YefM family antitoxin [Gemmataceae bacterium]